MINKNLVYKIIVLIYVFVLLVLLVLFTNLKVFSQTNRTDRDCSRDPYIVPSCQSGVTVDADCQAKRILNPAGQTCCILTCRDSENNDNITDEGLGKFTNFNIFGTRFRLDLTDPKTVESLISLFISTILGVFSLYALLKGAYLLGVKRPNLTKSEEIQKLNKDLVSLVTGFTLAWGLIFIIQIIFSLLGLGNIRNLELFNDQGGTVITIRTGGGSSGR